MVIMGWSLCKAGLDCYQSNGSITIDQPEMKLVLPLVRAAKTPVAMFLSHTNTGKHLEGLVSSPLLGGLAPRLPSGDSGPFNDFSWELQTKTETLQQQKSRARRID